MLYPKVKALVNDELASHITGIIIDFDVFDA